MTHSSRYHFCSQTSGSFLPPQATSTDEQCDHQAAQNPFGSTEPCLEAAAILSPTKITPVPKPRTAQPGKPQESSEKQLPSPSTAEASALPAQGTAFVPKVPPRRKKSAPAALHLQVLQSSDNPLLRGLMFNSNNNNPGLCPQPQDSAVLHAAPSQSALLAPTFAASPEITTTKQLAPNTEQIANLRGPLPLPGQHAQLPDSSSLAKNTGLLDLDSSCHLSLQAASTTSSAQTPENLKLPGSKDFSHWVTFSDDEDSGAPSEGFDKLLISEQNKNALVNTNNNLEL